MSNRNGTNGTKKKSAATMAVAPTAPYHPVEGGSATTTPSQKFFHGEEVLTSERFFLVGRGGHGNFHRGNRAVRNLVAEHALEYVETPRKDRAQISINLFDNHPLFQTCVFVTPRDYVLPRLEKDEESASNKTHGITLPNGDTIPPTLASQKRWLSRTRTLSIIKEHGSLDVIRSYPRGVYIEVGRDWAIDIIDHLCREQAHEIRKCRNETRGSAKKSQASCATASATAGPANEMSDSAQHESVKQEEEHAHMTQIEMEDSAGIVAAGEAVALETINAAREEQVVSHEPAEANRAQLFVSTDMMEAVQGLSALMKSEGSADGEFTNSNNRNGLTSNGGGELQTLDGYITAIGGDIFHQFPGDMHFVCGCVGFSVLDNTAFLFLIETYFREQIEKDENFRKDWENKLQRLKVRRHVPAILVRAHDLAKTQGKSKFRMWTAQRVETNGGRLQRLSEEVWAQSRLIDITHNVALLKQRLESPLRSILMTLKRHPSLVKDGGNNENDLKPLSLDNQREVSGSDVEDQDSARRQMEESAVSPAIEKKRANSEGSLVVSEHKDWRNGLPSSSFGAGDLGDPPTGWVFCRDISVNKLANSTQVSVVISNEQSGVKNGMENHLVWEAASRWRKELPAKRFVCWFDASTESSLCFDFMRFSDSIRQTISSEKKSKLGLDAAAQLFYRSLLESRSGAEFFLVFSSAPDPTSFATWVQPQSWFDDEGKLDQDLFSAVVIVPKHQSPHQWQSDVFKHVQLQTVHRIPDRRWKDDKPWWCELPLPNFPLMFSPEIDATLMEKVGQNLEMDGSLLALLSTKEENQPLPSVIANKFVRKWIMGDPSARFGFWLSAKNETSMRQSYMKAIACLTRQEELVEEMIDEIPPKVLAKELMKLLMHMRKLEPTFQWIVVFADVAKGCNFEEWFFPPESEWWRGRGRFAFTSSEIENLKVRVGEDSGQHLTDVPSVNVNVGTSPVLCVTEIQQI